MAYRTRSRRAPVARWMDLRYKGSCLVCKKTLMPGVRAFYDPSDRSVTCTNLPCAEEAGITEDKWVGSPVSGNYVRVLSEHRIGGVRRDTDGAPLAMTRYGLRRGYEHTGVRCEDAPCCGCCS